METLTTDENGAAQSGKLDPGTYTVHQIRGSDNYKIADDFDVTIKDGDKEIKNLNWIIIIMETRIRIRKTMVKNGKSRPEPGAVVCRTG